MPLTPDRLPDAYRQMLVIRKFEEAIRNLYQQGKISAIAMRATEDKCIREVVRWQEELGLQSITDGEFRRSFYHTDFLARLEGVSATRDTHHVSYQGRRKSLSFVNIPPK